MRNVLARLLRLVSMSANEPFSERPELVVQPSASCRFCQKDLKCRGNKVPRVSLFSGVKNKDLVEFSGVNSLVLADLASSLGFELRKYSKLSDVSCLTCARILARSHANIVKLFANESPRASGKRVSSARSPTGETPFAKRANVTATSQSRSRRSLGLDKENAWENDDQPLLGVSPITIGDTMESSMNLDGEQTVVKVSIAECYVMFSILIPFVCCFNFLFGAC